MNTKFYEHLTEEDLANEVWKPIFGYEEYYEVSNLGRVKSLPRNGTVKHYRILKPSENGGYLAVRLQRNGETKFHLIHRLVGIVFLQRTNLFDTIINHKNENKWDNRVSNLEWCDYIYNNNYGNRGKLVGEKLTNFKEWSKEILQYSLDGQFVQKYPSLHQMERETKFKRQGVHNCLIGKYKQAYNYLWRYA